ncbi:unnamed protein product [Protopolystoma xenopodis]|uniref:Uncharacterized protein n=1 Tax=Protopolystoma xenopodis TaxID=117903 RepID=A0A3S5CIL1_9PLAT|nr:unnamed protein product [Protopolystoma xenopodis]
MAALTIQPPYILCHHGHLPAYTFFGIQVSLVDRTGLFFASNHTSPKRKQAVNPGAWLLGVIRFSVDGHLMSADLSVEVSIAMTHSYSAIEDHARASLCTSLATT